jgi:hypothetical protein
MFSICDRNPQIRYESIELFRLALITSINRETAANTQSTDHQAVRLHRTSTQSSIDSMSTLNQEQQAKDEKVLVTDENLKKFKICFKSSIKDLELLLQDFGSANNNGKESGAGGQSSSKEDRIHGYL